VKRAIAKSVWAEIKTAFATGSVSLRELARQMNIPEGTILARAKREGWTREIQNAKALAKREDAAAAVTATEAVAITMQQRAERATLSAWRACLKRLSITSKQWAAPKSSTP
jgi:hypothetical protein